MSGFFYAIISQIKEKRKQKSLKKQNDKNYYLASLSVFYY
jgi:hypothetical protein